MFRNSLFRKAYKRLLSMQYDRELLSYSVIVAKRSELFSRLVESRLFQMMIWRGWSSLFASHCSTWIRSSAISELFRFSERHEKGSQKQSGFGTRQNSSMLRGDLISSSRSTEFISMEIQSFKQQRKISGKKSRAKIKKCPYLG